ncbi:MAG: ATP synthase F1 subunit epsilon [Gemmatimonadota bacterium]|nr:MAG: ATP synthase F1 subunit epsilon [Gemmatimonadota bacterium]
MPDKTFTLKIVTPEEEIFNSEVVSVVVPGTGGSFGVLANHAPLISQVEYGIVSAMLPDGSEVVVDQRGGYVKVKDNEMVLLASSATIEAEVSGVPR